MPVCDVAVVPEDFDGAEPDPDRPQGPEVVGELWIKGPQRGTGLLATAPRRRAQVFTRGWLHTGRRGPHRRGGLHLHRRPGQGHDHPRRRERLLGRGGGRPVRAPGGGRLRRHRHPRTRCSARRSGAVVVLRPGDQGRRRRTGRPRPRAAGRLQRADPVLVPQRTAAPQPRRQGRSSGPCATRLARTGQPVRGAALRPRPPAALRQRPAPLTCWAGASPAGRA